MKIKLTAFLCSMLVSYMANAQNIAIVNGRAIPKSKLDTIVKLMPNGSDPEVQKKIKNSLITRELFLQEAIKQQVILRPEVQLQIEEAKNAILFSALLDDFINKSINPAELKKQYQILIKTETGKQYRAKHILVSTLEEANSILKSLNSGKSFESLAKEKSIDKGSAVNGGDLDWAKPEMFVPEFSKAMVSLNKGQITEKPIKSQFGYHIVKLEDIKDGVPPPFEEVKESLVQILKNSPEWQKQKVEELEKILRSKAVIK